MEQIVLKIFNISISTTEIYKFDDIKDKTDGIKEEEDYADSVDSEPGN